MRIFGIIWKGARIWLITAASVLILALTVSLILTQNLFLYNMFNTAFGGPERVLKAGDPSQYRYFTPDEDCTDKETTLAKANELNEKICAEGIVLLKNEDGALPLKTEEERTVSVFGKNSVNLVYGGSGSGGANTADAVTLYDSFTASGIKFNPVLKKFYENKSMSGDGRPSNPGMNDPNISNFPTGETPWANYVSAPDVIDSFGSYDGAALVVFSRIGGEGFDLPRSKDGHYLRLDANERELLSQVCGAFDKVVVIVNCATSMELDFLDDPQYGSKIKAALWMGTPGFSGINALGKILCGEVNPSGRLVDTYARDFTRDPTWRNFGNNLEANGNTYKVGSAGTNTGNAYVYYEEGIYVGYRYYETRAHEERKKVLASNPLATEADREAWYDQNVVYPFGYGLSYTTFDWEIADISHEPGAVLGADDEITVTVKVTNTGEYEGKEVVQLYYSAPYEAGGIEKSHVVLGAFGKTDPIPPDGEDNVTLKLKVRNMASYDWDGRTQGDTDYRGYILEGGDYDVRLMKNAHDPSDIPALTFCVADDIKYPADDKTGKNIGNLFDDVNGEMKQNRFVRIMSRADFEGTFPTFGKDKEKSKPSSFFNDLRYTKNDLEDKPWHVAESNMPTYSKTPLSFEQTKIKLHTVRELEYDDNGEGEALWNELLDQLTLGEMSRLIGTGNFNTMQLEGIGKPKTIDPDGPAGFTIFMEMSSTKTVYGTCFYASECVVAATWNTELAQEMGRMIGNEGLWGNARGDGRPYSGWYAPAVNIHRSPLSGRNWEYYSEDGYLSGKMASAVIGGAKEKGVYTYLKHFALNEQETNREGVMTWADEQTMREIYFKPFELAVKEGGTLAIMSSFNRIGKVWAGGNYALLTSLLRQEWGFKGMVVTDFNTNANYMPADQMIRAGGDLNLCQDIQPSDEYTATQISAMRNATRNILYTVSRSNAMNGSGEGVRWGYSTPVWVIIIIWTDVGLVSVLAVWGFFALRKAFKKSRLQASAADRSE